MLILVPLVLALLAATVLMSLAWLRPRQEKGDSPPAADPKQAARNVDKLRDFHGLAKVYLASVEICVVRSGNKGSLAAALRLVRCGGDVSGATGMHAGHICSASVQQDALEAAHQKDRAGRAAEAAKTYGIGSQIIDEGLQLVVPSVGLGPAFSNTARWRADLAAWQPRVAHRWALTLAAAVSIDLSCPARWRSKSSDILVNHLARHIRQTSCTLLVMRNGMQAGAAGGQSSAGSACRQHPF